MVNHTRTVLLNIDVKPDGLYFLDEYIPANFKAVDLTKDNGLLAIYTALFPTSDYQEKLLYLYAYMGLLHAMFEEDILKYDSRITYNFDKPLMDFAPIDIVSVVNSINTLPNKITDILFEPSGDLDHVTLKEYFTDGSSYVDKLGSVLLGYIEKVGIGK